MKKTILLLFVLFLIPLAIATTETYVFFIGDSFDLPGKNITLIAIGDEGDNIVICVNNQKEIIQDDQIFNEVEFNFKDIENNYAELEVKAPSSGVCDDSCSNNLCFSNDPELQDENETQNEIILTDQECTSDSECDDGDSCTIDSCTNTLCSSEQISDCGFIVGEEKDNTALMVFSSILLILVIILLIILVFKKFKKKR